MNNNNNNHNNNNNNHNNTNTNTNNNNNNNNYNNDDKRFQKLYELLGDEVNSIYDSKDLFSNNDNNIFNNKKDNNKNNDKKDNDNNKDNSNIVFIDPMPVSINSINDKDNNNTEEDNLNNKKDNKKAEDNKNTFTHDKNSFRNKVLINNGDYGDGIDEGFVSKIDLKEILTNKKYLTIMFILIFVFVCIVVFKAFYYGKKVDHYEEFFTVIEGKDEEYTVVYDDKDIDNETLKKVAANELINCINAKVDEKNLPDSIKNIITEINNYYNQSYDYFSFLYRDIYTGFTVSYNQNQNIFTASTIKGPADIYLYEMASQGKIDLNEELTYTGGYYNTGSGILKNKSLNTKYSVRTLLEYSIVYSDNAAHNMLMDKYGRNNMLNFWKEKGTNAIFTVNNNWGVTNAHDASIYMQELYKFYVNNSEFGEPLIKNFMNANPKFITGKNNYIVANKSGWSGTAIHDVSIVFADNPYIVVALSNLGATDYYMSYFNKANDLAYKLHTEYWKYKMNECNNIKQY